MRSWCEKVFVAAKCAAHDRAYDCSNGSAVSVWIVPPILRTSAAIKSLLGLTPKTARRIRADGSDEDVALDRVVVDAARARQAALAAEMDAAMAAWRRRLARAEIGLLGQPRQCADDRHARIDQHRLLIAERVGVELLVAAVESVLHLVDALLLGGVVCRQPLDAPGDRKQRTPPAIAGPMRQ